ncbi:MAG: NifB/NifX family molybdenum-iron cluster-binding protein [archaeon]|nr:NifB/NifX family molybdenum-iron cluster-binding protein [archaeon]
MIIAIASRNGKTVDTHFGKSNSLYIYNFDEEKNETKFIEHRTIDIDIESKHQNQKIISEISDCDVVISLQHGGKSGIYAKNAGLKLVDDEGSIEEVLEKYINHVNFMKNIKI